MSYYLGKVGRAGARLVSSCRDLYYDVNAAYLTGAIDIIVVKQPDGSLQSTPFHVRFGKLGVLRTGDWKEVRKQGGSHMIKSIPDFIQLSLLVINYFWTVNFDMMFVYEL